MSNARNANGTITPLTMQEVFDNALFGLRKQGIRAINEDGQCLYRASNGNACSIGQSIPDSVDCTPLDASLNESPITSCLANNKPDAPPCFNQIKILFADCPPFFLSSIQTIHDSWLDGEGDFFERHMEKCAGKYGLSYTPVSE